MVRMLSVTLLAGLVGTSYGRTSVLQSHGWSQHSDEAAAGGRLLLSDDDDASANRILSQQSQGVPVLSVMTLIGAQVTNTDIPPSRQNSSQNGFLASPIADRVRTTRQPYAIADMVIYSDRATYTVTLNNVENLQGYGNIVSGQIHIRNDAKTPLAWLVGTPSAPLSVALPASGSLQLASGSVSFLPASPVQDFTALLRLLLDGALYTDIHSTSVISPYALLSGRPSYVVGFDCGSDGEGDDNRYEDDNNQNNNQNSNNSDDDDDDT